MTIVISQSKLLQCAGL